MAELPYMPVFCGDYLGDTMHLSLEEHGAYCKLLMITWQNGCRPLPDDDARIARMLGCTKERWAGKLRPVVAAFFDLADGTWVHHRLFAEWEASQHRSAVARCNGRKGGRRRKVADTPAEDMQSFANRGNFFKNVPRDAGGDLPQVTDPKPLISLETEKPQVSVGETGRITDSKAPHPHIDVSKDTSDSTTRPSGDKRGSRLPPDWQPGGDFDEWLETSFPEAGHPRLRKAVRNDLLDEFRDYWIAQPGQRGVKLDWTATYRNRIRDLAPRFARGAPPTLFGPQRSDRPAPPAPSTGATFVPGDSDVRPKGPKPRDP